MSQTTARQNRRRTEAVSLLRSLSAGVLTAGLLLTSPAAAMSIFDTIQLSKNGYSDQAIIDLIEATDSGFALKAEDLSKLKNLGVSEAVIRAMLGRTAASARIRNSAEHEDHSDESRPEASRGSSHYEQSMLTIAGSSGRFSLRSMDEKGGGGHVHLTLDLEGLRLLVLRDEAGYASIESRGRTIVRRIEEAWAEARGEFRARRLGANAEVVFVADSPGESSKSTRIMTVSGGDAQGYELRSGRGVTRDLLARYWADLFSDFWSLDHGDRAKRLLAIHEGEALALLGESLAQPERFERSLRSALKNLPAASRHHLQRLAETIPPQYGETGGH